MDNLRGMTGALFYFFKLICHFSFLFKLNFFFCLFLAALHLDWCEQPSSSCTTRAVERRLSSCGARDLLGPGIESMSPALTGGFLTPGPTGKSTGALLHQRWGSFTWGNTSSVWEEETFQRDLRVVIGRSEQLDKCVKLGEKRRRECT